MLFDAFRQKNHAKNKNLPKIDSVNLITQNKKIENEEVFLGTLISVSKKTP